MLVEEDRMTSKSLIVSIGTSSHLYNLVINIGNDREFCFCLALMEISCDFSNPRSIVLMCMILRRKHALERRMAVSFWEEMILLLIDPNHNLGATFRPLFSIGSPIPIHLSVFTEIRGANHSFRSSNEEVCNDHRLTPRRYWRTNLLV